jgi:WD40 repeat protein
MQVYQSAAEHVWTVTATDDRIAALSSSGVVVWKRNSPDPEQVLPGKYDGYKSNLVASRDGTWLLAFNGDHLTCWRSSRAGWKLHFEESRPRFCTGQFSADGNALSFVDLTDGSDGSIKFTVTERRLSPRAAKSKDRLVATYPAKPSSVADDGYLLARPWFATDLSGDGRWYMLSATEKAVHVWQTIEGRYVGNVKLRGITNEARFSPDGLRFAVHGGLTIYIYQTATLELITTWRVKHCYHPHLAWSPDSRLLAHTDGSTTVRVLDVDSRLERVALSARQYGRLSSAAFSPDGLTLLVGTYNGSVVVWDVD